MIVISIHELRRKGGKAVKSRLLAVFCLFVLLCACTPVPTNQGRVWQMYGTNVNSVPDTTLPPRGDTREMAFVISKDASEILRAAAAYFCKELGDISQGSIQMAVIESESPQNLLLNGEVQVGFLDQKGQMSFSRPLQATASSFLYTGYRNFTMRANASEPLSLLGRSLKEEGLIPLAAFYQGTRHFVTDFPVTNYLHLDGATLAVGEDPELQQALERLGVQTITTSTLQETLKLYEDDEISGLEVTLEELAALSELPKDSYLLLCGHHTVPVWLLARADFLDSLSPAQQAGIQELCAYLFNFIDDRQVEREQQLLNEIGIPGLSMITDFSNVRNRVFNTLEPLSSDALASEVVARDLVNIMRRIT